MKMSRPTLDAFPDEVALDSELSRPSEQLTREIAGFSSPLLILGAGGKMGPTLAVMARRAAVEAGVDLDVVAVSRFSGGTTRQWLEQQGVTTLCADLLESSAVRNLPDTANAIFMVGMKFGTSTEPARTWAVNTLVPASVMQRWPRARLVALSTGNVYAPVRPESGGSVENQPLTPLGEYANSAVARERIFEFFSAKNTTPVALIRLNYAVELRYGVLADIARKVWLDQPVELANGYLNCIWQRDANEFILRAMPLATTPASAWNLTGPQLRVREIASKLGQLLGRTPHMVGEERETALLSNPAKLAARLGQPSTSVEDMLRWTAHWVRSGGRSLDKPTHFEVTDGKY